jgi:hypothetical protein
LRQFVEAGHGHHRAEHFALDDFIVCLQPASSVGW